jgi:2-aminoadipate transaminase
VLARAVEQNVAFVPGAPFYANSPKIETLRLAFVTVPPARIEVGVECLGRVIRSMG